MKILSLVSLLVSFLILEAASSLDLQIKRLDYVQQQIDAKRKELNETQNQKGLISKQKNSSQVELDRCLLRIDQLTQEEHELIKDIIRTEHNIETFKKNKSFTGILIQEQFKQFLVDRYANHSYPGRIIAENFFPLLMKQTLHTLMENKELLSDTQQYLNDNKEQRTSIISLRQNEHNKSGTIKEEIEYLTSIITSLSQEELNYLEKINNLERNRLALETLIADLQSNANTLTYRFTEERLIWPVNGQIKNYFGDMRDETYNFIIKNNGIDIKSLDDATVCAIDFGIVVFAEAFRNYGRMVIIDHRNGYYSLYANNSSLMVTKGDIVELGEPIALLSKKSNEDYYLLHFELRRHNKPVDPLNYLE